MNNEIPMHPDKNLRNTVEDLSVRPPNGQEAQQLQQEHNDRRKKAMKYSKHKPLP